MDEKTLTIKVDLKLVVAVLLLVGLVGFVIASSSKDSDISSEATSASGAETGEDSILDATEGDRVRSQIEKLIQPPVDKTTGEAEAPALTKITSNPGFFSEYLRGPDGILVGDYMVVYNQGDSGFVFRSSENKIVHVFSPSAVKNRVGIQVYGASQARVDQLRLILESAYDQQVFIIESISSKLTASDPIAIVDIHKDQPEALAQIIEALGGVAGELPEGLEQPVEEISFAIY